MDSFKFHDIKLEKANAISRYHRIQRLTTLFRFLELFLFLIILSRCSTQFSFPFTTISCAQYFRGISSATLISPRVVFILGNAIVILLFLISGQFPGNKGDKTTDFYEEYVQKCRGNQQPCIKEEEKALTAYKNVSVCFDEKKMRRSQSQNLERAVLGEERRRDLRRSMSEKCRKSVHSGRKAAEAEVAAPVSSYAEDRMSSEEFRRTVEAFIARQQRFLREEEDFSAVVSI